MERIREYLKTKTGCICFLDWRDDAMAWWQKETGLPWPEDGWMLVEEEIKARLGEQVERKELPVILSPEEAKAVAEKLGADKEAEDLRAAIVEKATIGKKGKEV